MNDSFEQLKRTWVALGKDDPLWAVVSHPDKRNQKWDPVEFFQTGVTDVEHFHQILQNKGGVPPRLTSVLDFGCGVGRLTQAWSLRAERVAGVDISRTMVDAARNFAHLLPNIEFYLNEKPDLKLFSDRSFDLIFSLVCLQHMPWELAQGYVREFGRITKNGGWVGFQLPTRCLSDTRLPLLRKKIVNAFPFGLGRKYRKWKNGSADVFDMYYTPSEEVLAVAQAVGLKLQHQEPDPCAGPGTEGFFYIFKKAA